MSVATFDKGNGKRGASDETSYRIMRHSEFLVVEDPEHAGRLLYPREQFEIDTGRRRDERAMWSRLIAFQLIYGSLLWLFLFGRLLESI